ncbi:MAG: protein kinase [Pseudomonadota bacterium]
MSQATAYDTTLLDPGLPNGTTLSGDQFTITRRLSAGGFGITYLAEDNTLGRTVVIKECFPEDFCMRDGTNVIVRSADKLNQFRSIVKMFMREARSLAKLRHPNIVGVHRAFEENDTAYMALDLIDGHDMLDILESPARTQFTPERVKDILLQLLHAIETVHDADLLHRDISPDNIIIEKTGVPVLIDFGAARGDASRRTRAISSMLVVKDGYSPQEFYLAGSMQTPSSDLYALGATFYHVISGKAPPNSQVRLAEVASDNPDPCVPLAGRIEGYEHAFLEAIDLAMEVAPRNRLQSAGAWRSLIEDCVPSRPIVVADAVTASPPKQITPDIDRLLTRLIEETNEEVEKSRVAPMPPKPVELVQAKEPEKPEWLEEFNEESRQKDAIDRTQEAILAEAAPSPTVAVPEPEPRKAPKSRLIFAQDENPAPDTMVAVKRNPSRVLSRPIATSGTAPRQNSRMHSPSDVATAPQRDLARHEAERQALTQQFRASSPRPTSLKRTVVIESTMFDAEFEDRTQMIASLGKYLITGIVLGLGLILLYPALL